MRMLRLALLAASLLPRAAVAQSHSPVLDALRQGEASDAVGDHLTWNLVVGAEHPHDLRYHDRRHAESHLAVRSATEETPCFRGRLDRLAGQKTNDHVGIQADPHGRLVFRSSSSARRLPAIRRASLMPGHVFPTS